MGEKLCLPRELVMPLLWLSFSGFALLFFHWFFVSSVQCLVRPSHSLCAKKLLFSCRSSHSCFLLFSESLWRTVRACSCPEHHGVSRGKVVCICMNKLTVWRRVLMLIDFLPLFHVQMICYITAININNLLAEEHGTKS